MRIYLDNCCLQRPLDLQTQPRIRVETEAVFAVLAAVLAKEWVLCGSEVLEYEISRIPDAARRAESISVLSLATEFLQITQAVELRALSLEHQGLNAMDALHLATASEAKVDYFCSCDDKLLRKAGAIPGLGCRIISLLNLVVEISP
jgi:predicted nucleic acid-binding protein